MLTSDEKIAAMLGLIAVLISGYTFLEQTASHREGPEHDQHEVCDQYSKKDKS